MTDRFSFRVFPPDDVVDTRFAPDAFAGQVGHFIMLNTPKPTRVRLEKVKIAHGGVSALLTVSVEPE